MSLPRELFDIQILLTTLRFPSRIWKSAVIEFAEGWNLKQFLARAECQFSENVFYLFGQIFAVIHAFRSQKLAHENLKPNKNLLGKSETDKITILFSLWKYQKITLKPWAKQMQFILCIREFLFCKNLTCFIQTLVPQLHSFWKSHL